MSNLATLTLIGCAFSTQTDTQNVSGDATNSASAPTSSRHVFVIMMENKGYDEALGGDYTSSLARTYAVAPDYHAVAHPSLPNYLALTSGSTWGVKSDEYQSLPSNEDVGSELTSAGIAWRAYMEDMSDGCFDSPKPYALKHNPFAFYGGRCPQNVVDLSQLDADHKQPRLQCAGYLR